MKERTTFMYNLTHRNREMNCASRLAQNFQMWKLAVGLLYIHSAHNSSNIDCIGISHVHYAPDNVNIFPHCSL